MNPLPHQFYVSAMPDGLPRPKPRKPMAIPAVSHDWRTRPDRYYADGGVAAAVNTALLLGLPLLVTGKPGCGKTQLGAAVAHALGFEHFIFETKSVSQAKDLFYTFDVVGRFQARQARGGAQARSYIAYQALGRAILQSRPFTEVKHLMKDARGAKAGWGAGRPSVVVVDEIDKAPRDFPNDILNEIDKYSFTIPELDGVRVEASAKLRPFVIFTSNSEKLLPDPFLRRCVYCHIGEPDPTSLAKIVDGKFAGAERAASQAPRAGLSSADAMVKSATGLYLHLRDDGAALKKPPSLAEFLNWLNYLREMGAEPSKPLARQAPELVEASLAILLKYQDDRVPILAALPGLLARY
jgi:MoxR-like ATPase